MSWGLRGEAGRQTVVSFSLGSEVPAPALPSATISRHSAFPSPCSTCPASLLFPDCVWQDLLPLGLCGSRLHFIQASSTPVSALS